MNYKLSTLFIVLGLIAVPFSILHAQHQIGHTTITFNDPDRTGGYGSGGGPGRQIQTEVYYPADVAGTDVAVANGEFPVIVFGHGFVMAWSAYENIWEELVSQGYIMAFPRTEGGFSPSHEEFGADLSLVLDDMLGFNQDNASLFYEKLNNRSAIMGHSMGGGSSMLAAAQNSNANTVIGLAPAETNPSAIAAAENISIPALILSGQNDGVTPDDEHHIPIYNALDSDCKYFVSILGGAHCYFANSNFNCDFGEGTASSGISVSRTEQQQTSYDAYTPWLDFYLKRICAAKADFDDFIDNDPRIEATYTCNYEYPSIPTISENNGVLTSSSAYDYEWYLDGNLIPNENDQDLTATESGDYVVVIFDEYGCSAESAPINVEVDENVTSIHQYNKDSAIKLYPNPTSEKITLEVFSTIIGKGVILDQLGRNVMDFNLIDTHVELNLSHLPKGLYFVEIYQDGIKLNKKFIKR